MTRQRKKDDERIWIERACVMLGADWRIKQEGEAPDFVLTHGNGLFGLEVRDIYTGGTITSQLDKSRGSASRRLESQRQNIIAEIWREYQRQPNAVPLSVKFRGHLSGDVVKEVVHRLAASDFHTQPLGHQTPIDLADGRLHLHITKSLHPHWVDINTKVGWVNCKPEEIITAAIRDKANRLPEYIKNSGLDDIRLLLVANRLNNSGKLRLGDTTRFDLYGFNTVYFLSYPESITELKK